MVRLCLEETPNRKKVPGNVISRNKILQNFNRTPSRDGHIIKATTLKTKVLFRPLTRGPVQSNIRSKLTKSRCSHQLCDQLELVGVTNYTLHRSGKGEKGSQLECMLINVFCELDFRANQSFSTKVKAP